MFKLHLLACSSCTSAMDIPSVAYSFPPPEAAKNPGRMFQFEGPLCHFFLAWVGASGKTHIAVDQYQYGKGKAACFNKELFIATC